MPNRIRRLLAVAATAVLILSLVSPAGASTLTRDDGDRPNSVPMIFDVLIMRPIGLVATVVGTVVYAFPVAPIMAITRPTDIAKPLGPLVVAPGRFTFADPIGEHP